MRADCGPLVTGMSPPTVSLIVRLLWPSLSAVKNRREDGATTLENVLDVSYKVNILGLPWWRSG